MCFSASERLQWSPLELVDFVPKYYDLELFVPLL